MAGAVKDRPPVFMEGGKPASSGSGVDCGARGLPGRRRAVGVGGGGQEGFLTKRL